MLSTDLSLSIPDQIDSQSFHCVPNPTLASSYDVANHALFSPTLLADKSYFEEGLAQYLQLKVLPYASNVTCTSNGWDAGGTVSLKPYTSITERVSNYSTSEAQTAAWQQLETAVASCDTKTKERVSSGDPSLYYSVTQSVATVNEGFAVTERSVARTKDKTINGSSTITYTTYRQSGTAIIAVDYYQNLGKKISAGKKEQVESLADTLTSRWSQR